VFVDEIFKANSSILNSLLSALNERVFDNGGKRQKIPLEVVIGASNELPEDDTLDAIYDRFCLRHWVSYIKDRDNRRRLMQMKGEPVIAVRLQSGDLAKLRELRKQVIVPEEVEESLLDICERLAEEIGVTVSDRRLRKSMKLVRANAIRNGRVVAEKGDLMILANSLWLEPEQAPAVYGVVAECSSPALADALRLLDAATEVFSTLDFQASGGQAVAQLADANREIRKMLKEVQALSSDAAISGVASKIEAMANQIAREVRSQIGGI
jgi:MoxR-like ATPase